MNRIEKTPPARNVGISGGSRIKKDESTFRQRGKKEEKAKGHSEGPFPLKAFSLEGKG